MTSSRVGATDGVVVGTTSETPPPSGPPLDKGGWERNRMITVEKNMRNNTRTKRIRRKDMGPPGYFRVRTERWGILPYGGASLPKKMTVQIWTVICGQRLVDFIPALLSQIEKY